MTADAGVNEPPAEPSSGRISPTAHYTGWVWARNGLSHPELETLEGRLLVAALDPLLLAVRAVGAPSLERYLLARHSAIDRLLHGAIKAGTISQIVELACGLSPRGWRFAREFGEAIDYIEADLPGMAARKRDALERAGSLGPHHRVAEVDVLVPSGPGSLDALGAELDPERGTVVITEGLLSYLELDAVTGLWRRIATLLHAFPAGRYLADLHLSADQNLYVRAFRLGLSAFVRGGVALHFDRPDDAELALGAAGFDEARVWAAAAILGEYPGGGATRVHIIEASTN